MIKATRRSIIAALPVLVGALASLRSFATTAKSNLTFLSVGDWGRDGASHQRDVAVQMGITAQALMSRFVISVGDNFYDNGVQTADDAQWRTSFEEVYTAPSLQTPWYVVLGNHDYRGVPQAQLDYAARSTRWRMPARYYKVSGEEYGFPAADFFFIDTSPMVNSYRKKVDSAIAANVRDQDPDAQFAWLETHLAASTAPWKLVFGHHTVYSGGTEHGNTPELVARLKPILERYGVQAYINGHEHDLQHIRVGTVDYICTGAGSEVRPTTKIDGTQFAVARSGFSVFSLTDDNLRLEFRDFTGASLYVADLPLIRT